MGGCGHAFGQTGGIHTAGRFLSQSSHRSTGTITARVSYQQIAAGEAPVRLVYGSLRSPPPSSLAPGELGTEKSAKFRFIR